MSTITSANAKFAIVIPGVYNAPKILQGWGSDDAFATEAVENAEVKMGVDGKLSAGFVFNPIIQNIVLQADSDSIDVFNNWQLAQLAGREVISCSATITISSIGYSYVLTNGYLTQFKPLPDAKKVLQQVQHRLTWEKVIGAKI
jgi:hypothetical protein